MEAGLPTSTAAGGAAPFLIKTYDMVDDSATDDIVSWSSTNNSFVVWDPPEFARRLLPAYFKHNNFSSFIRQLNTYGFRKIDPERWEFSNEEFIKDQKHLLKNIHRRKPIHSHSHPQVSLDPERAAFDEEIARLSREKAQLQASLVRYDKERSSEKVQLEDLTKRVDNLAERQGSLLSVLEKSVQNPTFVKCLIEKIEAMDVSAYSKKRRLPQVEESRPVVDNGFECSSRPEFGNVIHQDFSNKLRLELSPAVSDVNLFSHSTQSSNEDGASQQGIFSGPEPREPAALRPPGLLFSAPETLDLSDTGTSCTFKVDSAFPRKVAGSERLGLLSLQQNLSSSDEGDGHISCLLNLSLASCSLQVNKSQTAKVGQEGQGIGTSAELRSNVKDAECDTRSITRHPSMSIDEKPDIASAPNKTIAAPGRVNDVFWEQFLTERPGSSENEEASSHYRANLHDEQEDPRSGHGLSKNGRSMEQLSL